MKNIKGFAVGTDGNMKRIAITYDAIDDSGKVVNSNVSDRFRCTERYWNY